MGDLILLGPGDGSQGKAALNKCYISRDLKNEWKGWRRKGRGSSLWAEIEIGEGLEAETNKKMSSMAEGW